MAARIGVDGLFPPGQKLAALGLCEWTLSVCLCLWNLIANSWEPGQCLFAFVCNNLCEFGSANWPEWAHLDRGEQRYLGSIAASQGKPVQRLARLRTWKQDEHVRTQVATTTNNDADRNCTDADCEILWEQIWSRRECPAAPACACPMMNPCVHTICKTIAAMARCLWSRLPVVDDEIV